MDLGVYPVHSIHYALRDVSALQENSYVEINFETFNLELSFEISLEQASHLGAVAHGPIFEEEGRGRLFGGEVCTGKDDATFTIANIFYLYTQL